MLKISADGGAGPQTVELGYATARQGLVPRQVLRLTRWLRARHAGRYMPAGGRHLDIGCGDGYFLKRSPAAERYGLDRLFGDEVTDRLDFPDAYFDVVTMLAVIEHVAQPEPLIAEIARVLKPGGRLIVTTPKRAAEPLIRLYVKDIDDEHQRYFTLETFRELAGEAFDLAGHHTFILGLNQVFCLRKRPSLRGD